MFRSCKTFGLSCLSLLIFGLLWCSCTQRSTRMVSHTLNDKWKFVQGDDIAYAKPHFDDLSWVIISSTRAFESQGFPHVDGYVWYRKHFTIPADLERQIGLTGGMNINLGTIDDVDQLYVNGMLIGGSGSFPPRYVSAFQTERNYIIPASCLVRGKNNVLAVRIYDGNNTGGILADSIVIRNLSAEEMTIFSNAQRQK